MFLIKIYNNYFSDMTDIINYTFFKKLATVIKHASTSNNKKTKIHMRINIFISMSVNMSLIR